MRLPESFAIHYSPVRAPVSASEDSPQKYQQVYASEQASEHIQRESFYSAIHPHLGGIRKVLCSLCGSAVDVDDIIQQSLLKAFRNLAQLRSPDLLRSWLLRIAINEMRRVQRTNARTHCAYVLDGSRGNDDADQPIDGQIVDSRETPAEVLEREEVERLLRSQFCKLPSAWRMMLVQHDILNVSAGTIAKRLGKSEGYVRSNLCRARFTLRELLSPLTCRRGRGSGRNHQRSDETPLS